MPELISLLDGLDDGGIEASLITTFNAYLPFYEDVVLRRLLATGCRHNTVLIDAGQLSACLGDPAQRPASAGYEYTLASIRSNAAFHPKLLLLVGPKRAVTSVGSHNLTLSGFGLNREITCKTTWAGGGDDAGSDIARAAWRATRGWLDSGGTALPPQTRKNILAIEEIAPWLRAGGTIEESCRLLYQATGTASLWDQLRGLMPSTAKRITVVGAFFDSRCEFLHRLHAELPNAKLRIAIEPDTVHLTRKGAARIRGAWLDASKLTDRPGYLHAKFIYIEGGGRPDLLLLGSANPSSPAWGVGQGERNEELVIAWTGSRASAFAKHLRLGDVQELPEIGPQAFRKIDAAAAARKERAIIPNPLPAIAVVTPDGIEIAKAGVALPESIDALDDRSDAFLTNISCRVDGPLIRASIGRDVADRIRFVRLRFRGGTASLLICHHAERRENAARTGRREQLRIALSGLVGDPDSIAKLIAAVQKVVFGSDASVVQPAPASRSKGKGSGGEGEDVTSLEGDPNVAKKHRLRPRLAGGDLGYLLQVLIYELGKSIPSAAAGGATSTRSEEEQVGADDETPADRFSAIETDQELVQACARKVGTLVNRMVRVLHDSLTDPEASLTTVAQLTAVLCTLRALRQLDRQERWQRTGMSFVPEEHRQKLLGGIVDAVIGGPTPLMRRSEVLAVGNSMEVVHLRGLMVWLAWECKLRADRRFSLGDEIEERADNVLQRAALLELVLPTLRDDDARSEAERSVHSTSSPRQALSASQWLQTHFAWGRRVARGAADARDHPTKLDRHPASGSIVALPRALGQSLHVVARQDGVTVVLLDLTAANYERGFMPDKLLRVAAP